MLLHGKKVKKLSSNMYDEFLKYNTAMFYKGLHVVQSTFYILPYSNRKITPASNNFCCDKKTNNERIDGSANTNVGTSPYFWN